ncbi:dTDP-4-dehydrorhamnose 3,5-epimerase-like enzyme [Aeromonas salmonicida]|uniref:sugar 3,4-ketoisomerase n=1 Tax=Aeromonas salmonicida TaxID=645 RepID=UPI002858DEFD|nr:FdtA/QdtA family cupin domain-containing protein [Aeromonas salmonicida]MDR6994372.1 dTDP-4-dehydrorhamnose 3,5-epimerase-like enzyme [Aeromonas salmonicida]
MKIQLIQLQTHGDARGALVALEDGKNVPFEIHRVYYLFATQPDVTRGLHAHRELKQMLIAVRGSCRILLDDGKEKVNVLLDDPAQGLIIDSLIWREMYQFSDDCVLLVLANQHFDETDYIRDYSVFINLVEKK